MLSPGSQTRRQPRLLSLSQGTRIQIPCARVTGDEKVISARLAIGIDQSHRRTVSQVGIKSPAHWHRTARLILKHQGHAPVKPGRRIVIPHVMPHIETRLDASILSNIAALLPLLDRWLGVWLAVFFL